MTLAVPLTLLLGMLPLGAPDDDATVFAWPMVSGGIVADPQAIGGGPQLALSWRPWSFLEPEIIVGTGGFAGTNEFTQRFSIGTRLILPSQTLQPFAWAAYSHFHETTFAAFEAAPIEAMLSLSDVGVAHRSGAEAGVGVVLPVAVQRWRDGSPLRVMLRGTAMYLPDFGTFSDVGPASPSHLYLLVELGIGLPLQFDPGALREPRIHTPRTPS